MHPTARFRRQHAELQRMAIVLTRTSLTPGADPVAVRRLLAGFAGKLRVHAAMETDALYPALLESEDEGVQSKAQRLYEDLGPLYDAFDAFEEKWATADAIGARFIRFRIDLMRMLNTLGRRMIRENRELYPMVDAAAEAG